MSYYSDIQEKLEKGEVIGNDSNPQFIWTSFTRGKNLQVHIYKGEELTILNYKSFRTLAKKVGTLLNRGY